MKLPLSARQAAVFLLTLLGLGTVIFAQDTGYALKWHSLGSGGTSSGDGYTLRAFVGGVTAATSSGGGMSLIAGAPPGSTIPPTSLPDLVVESMTITLESGGACNYASMKLGLRIGIANRGQAAAGASTLAVNGSTRVAVGALAQGASTSIWVATYLSGENAAVIDVDSQVAESDETNNRLTQFLPVPTLPPTCTPTATPNKPPTNTPTATPIGTPSAPLPGADDAEPDDACAQAPLLTPDSVPQVHSFHRPGDEDWLAFAAVGGRTYAIDAYREEGSPADLVAELYTDCADAPIKEAMPAFSSDVRLVYTATTTALVYVRLLNHDPRVYGPQVRYRPELRTVQATPRVGAAIIVAGRLESDDPLQANIRNLAGSAYGMFAANGHTDNSIYYLSPDFLTAGHDPRIDAAPTLDNLGYAITNWAANRVDENRALTIYLVDHGVPDLFHLDEVTKQRLTPQQLDRWLDELEGLQPGVSINIILEACYSGSFIEGVQHISAPNRVVISATDADSLAYSSGEGAIFSDRFWSKLYLGRDLAASFMLAQTHAQKANGDQVAWIDADGDQRPNEEADLILARERGFQNPSSFASYWEPEVVTATLHAPIQNGQAEISALVRDDSLEYGGTVEVWAAIYPPSYAPPPPGTKWAPDAPYTLPLEAVTGEPGIYRGLFTQFNERGTYRVVVQARDFQGLVAQSVVLEAGGQLFLPVVTR